MNKTRVKGDNIDITIQLSDLLIKDNEMGKQVDYAIGAAITIVEKAYVQEVPVNIGDFRSGIQTRRRNYLHYIVESTATNKGRNYPLYLFLGTGRQMGRPDSGYTPGHVRAGTIAYGIGGIRPNKASQRAKDKSEVRFMYRLNQLVHQVVK